MAADDVGLSSLDKVGSELGEPRVESRVPPALARRRSPLAAWLRKKRAPRAWWLVGLMLLVVCVYAFFGSLGRPWRAWPVFTVDYDLLSQAFRQGHLYLPIEPNPELVRQENPYDPAHVDLWVLDETYYRGKYYLYWGPVPPLLQALVKRALGIYRLVGDQYLVFAAWSFGTSAAALLLHRLTRRLFGGVPRGVLAACVVAFAFANPVLHLVANAAVYQAAISCGQCFLLLGVWLACDGVFHAHREKHQRVRWLLTGLCWGLAVGSRLSLAPATGLLLLNAALFSGPLCMSREGQADTWLARSFRGVNAAFWMGLPLLAAVGGLLLYNKARFDDYFESGINLQLTVLKYRFSAAYIPANLYTYFFQRFRFDTQFPYVFQLWHLGRSALPSWLPFPDGYFTAEPLVGVLRVVPVVWLAPVALLTLFGVKLRGLWRRRSARALLFAHACTSFLIIGSITAVPIMGLYVPSMRYLGDFSSGLVLLGLLGGLTLYARARRRPIAGRAIGATICALSLLTVLCGMLLGYQGYTNTFQSRNPALHEVLERHLSF